MYTPYIRLKEGIINEGIEMTASKVAVIILAALILLPYAVLPAHAQRRPEPMVIRGYVFIHEPTCESVAASKVPVFAVMEVAHGMKVPIMCNVTDKSGRYVLRILGSPHWEGKPLDIWVKFVNVTRVTLQYGVTLQLNLTVEFQPTIPFGFAFGHMVRWSMPRKVHFIYPEPKRMTRPGAVHDRMAGNLTHDLCNCTQNVVYDSDSEYVEQTGECKGRVRLNNSVVVLFGGPYPNLCVNYYERTNATPVKFYWNETDDTFNFILTKTGEVVASMPRTADFEHEDVFVIEVFEDENGNTVFIFYGFDHKGTWASGIYMHHHLINQLDKLENSFYICRWVDANNDGEPQSVEIQVVYP